MARVHQSGWELNSTDGTNEVEWSALAGTVEIVTSPARSGSYAQDDTSLGSGTAESLRYNFVAAANSGPFFFRVALRVNTRPSAANRIIHFNNAGTMVVAIDLNADGSLQLRDEDGTIGSASSVLTLDAWYLVEIRMDRTPAAGSHVVEARLAPDDKTTPAVFATASNRSLSAGITNIRCGANLAAEAQTTGNWYFDDFALNDSSGSFQTSYPGVGSIVLLRPSADGDNHGFTVAVGGTAGAANNFTRVQEITPDGNTSYNADAVTNDTDDYNIDNTPAAIGASDTINVVMVGVRYAAAIASLEAAFVLRVKASSGGTVEESAAITPNSVAFQTNANATPRLYPLILYDLPGASTTAWTKADLDAAQIGMRISTGNTNAAQISTIWMSVDSTPVVASTATPTIFMTTNQFWGS